MVNKKGLILFLGLLLPIIIFVFLKFFGKNEFDVPLLFEEGVESPCAVNYPKPYVLPDSVWNLIAVNGASLIIIDFSEKPSVRIRSEVAEDRQVAYKAAGDIVLKNQSLLKSCVFLLSEQQHLVVVDKNRRIRGQYNVNDRDDLDRFYSELVILLKKY